MIARLASDMLPIATDAASGARGPDVAPAVVFVPCEEIVIVPVEKSVALLPNNVAISCRVEP